MTIFEYSTSPLYYSDDGVVRLSTEYDTAHLRTVYALTEHVHGPGDVVLRTFQRAIADAYIAGYDLACRVWKDD
jgi:hypothetical protein